MKVLVVLDPDFGRSAQPVDAEGFWLIESPANRSLAERLWSRGGYDPNSAVFRDDSSAETVVSKLATVDLHHPNWSEIVVVGATAPEDLRSAFGGEAVAVAALPDGFRVTR